MLCYIIYDSLVMTNEIGTPAPTRAPDNEFIILY